MQFMKWKGDVSITMHLGDTGLCEEAGVLLAVGGSADLRRVVRTGGQGEPAPPEKAEPSGSMCAWGPGFILPESSQFQSSGSLGSSPGEDLASGCLAPPQSLPLVPTWSGEGAQAGARPPVGIPALPLTNRNPLFSSPSRDAHHLDPKPTHNLENPNHAHSFPIASISPRDCEMGDSTCRTGLNETL